MRDNCSTVPARFAKLGMELPVPPLQFAQRKARKLTYPAAPPRRREKTWHKTTGRFDPDGTQLYLSNDSVTQCWDTRDLHKPLFSGWYKSAMAPTARPPSTRRRKDLCKVNIK